MRDYDEQLLESVAVRRRRLRDALTFGSARARRTFDHNIGRAFVGLILAGAVGAGSVGWSYVQAHRDDHDHAQAGVRARDV